MKLYSIFLLVMAFINQCSGSGNLPENNFPACILEKVEALQQEPVRNPPAFVAEYRFNGEKVYYIPPAAGDQMSELYSKDCVLICRPEGGISGRGDGKCPDFIEERSEEKIIWKDERK